MRGGFYFSCLVIYVIFVIWQAIILYGSASSSLNLLHEILFGTDFSATSGSQVFDILVSVLAFVVDLIIIAPFYNAFAPILDVVGFFQPLKGLEVYVRAGSILIALASYPFMLVVKFLDPHE